VRAAQAGGGAGTRTPFRRWHSSLCRPPRRSRPGCAPTALSLPLIGVRGGRREGGTAQRRWHSHGEVHTLYTQARWNFLLFGRRRKRRSRHPGTAAPPVPRHLARRTGGESRGRGHADRSGAGVVPGRAALVQRSCRRPVHAACQRPRRRAPSTPDSCRRGGMVGSREAPLVGWQQQAPGPSTGPGTAPLAGCLPPGAAGEELLAACSVSGRFLQDAEGILCPTHRQHARAAGPRRAKPHLPARRPCMQPTAAPPPGPHALDRLHALPAAGLRQACER